MDEMQSSYDVVVLGGGAAGLSGAIALARSRRSVVVIDSGEPRNRPAAGVHNLLGREGIAPAELLARGRAELQQFGGEVVRGEAVDAEREGAGFRVVLADGRETRARRLLVASGLTDQLPDVPGVAELWGTDVLHCPYCHGWEVRDQAIGVLSAGPMSVHIAQLFRQLSADVALFTHTSERPTDQQLVELEARDIKIIDGPVAALEVVDGRLAAVRLADGTTVPRQAVAVAPRLLARARFLATLGLRPVDHRNGMGQHIPVDESGRTEVPGVWAAGNVTDIAAQVGAAASAGMMAGAQINLDLINEETAAAVAAHGRQRDPAEADSTVDEQAGVVA